MATGLKGLSGFNNSNIPNAAGMKIALVVADWNSEITYAMRDGALSTLAGHGVQEDHIHIAYVPGSFELTLGAKWLADTGKFDAIICIGCVIQGETRHFDYICDSVTQGITRLNMDYSIPVIFGVLTTNTKEQAEERSGGKHGNKGDEAAITAIRMVDLNREISNV